ncbi:ATP-binding cassette domain-containing protein [Vulcanococcus limneticus]|uniref:ATP-binding cassette domain-containing protein n=1 Tax=Vulcanococcus limneticus TaxID=2170428 RepID=UPI00398BE808
MTSRNSLLRDLTLSPEAPLAFCLRLLLQQLMWTGQPEELFELIGDDPRTMDLVDVRNVLLRLGYGSRSETLQSWSQLNPNLLPSLYLAPDNMPYVLSRDSKGEIMAGHVGGRVDPTDLPSGGQLVVLQEHYAIERVGLLQQIAYRFTNRISLLYAISFALALLALTLPLYIRAIYNISIPSNSVASTIWIFIGVLVLFGLDWVLRQWRASQLALLSGRIESLMGVSIVEKLFSLDYRQIESVGRNGLYFRLRNLESLLGYLQGPLALACLDFPFIVIYLAAVFMIAGGLVIIPIVLMVITAVVVLFLTSYYAGAANLTQTTGTGISLAQQELVSRFLEVKTANIEWVWLQRLRGLSAQSSMSSLALNRQANRLQALLSTMSQLAGVLTLSLGAWMVIGNSRPDPTAMGSLIAAMFFVWRIFTPFQQMMNALLRYADMTRQYRQLEQFLRLRSSGNANAGSSSSILRLRGNVILDSAACRLSNDSGLALSRVSLSVSPGQILAVTGTAGSGKSVTLKLIDQLYALTAGTLLFDGNDYRQFSTEALQRNIAYLMPSLELLPGTIWSNLTAMNPDATVEGVRCLCEDLGILELLEALPDGLNTPLSKEISHHIPFGVRKLIALAQAVIKDTPILLLDDISQGLAPDQFQCVLEVLPSLRYCLFSGQERSVVLSTDNKALLELADRLCILDKGVTAFQGTAAELRAQMQQRSVA